MRKKKMNKKSTQTSSKNQNQNSGVKNIMLYPNCSEICWRLDFPYNRTTKEKICDTLAEKEVRKGKKYETDTSTFPNNALEDMIGCIKGAQKKKIPIKDITIEILDEGDSGGDGYYISQLFDVAKDFCEGKITMKQAEKKDEKLCMGEEDADPDG
jgi:hypothetical protein